MPLRRMNLLNNQNMQQFMGQSQFPMRGLERFIQKRGMNFQGMPPGGAFQVPKPQVGNGNLSNTLNVEVPPKKKTEAIKEFFGKFRRKS